MFFYRESFLHFYCIIYCFRAPPPPPCLLTPPVLLVDCVANRQRILSARPDETQTRGEKLWTLDIERFRSVFRPGGRWNESPDADPDTLEGMPFRAGAMQVLLDIENEEVGTVKTVLPPQHGYRNPDRRQQRQR